MVESLCARLRSIGEIYQESGEELAAPGGRPLERVSGTRSVGIRLDDEVLSLRSEIADLLSSWAGLVMAERRSPAAPGEGVPGLLRFLRGQIPWLVEHPAGPDLDAELAALVDSSSVVLGPRPDRVSLGTCCRPDCDAPLQATLSGVGGMAFSRVACDAGHAVPPRDWLLLAAVNRGQQGETA